jgi:hypothetical protein
LVANAIPEPRPVVTTRRVRHLEETLHAPSPGGLADSGV